MFKIFVDEETGKGILPKYAVLPLSAVFVVNYFTYYISKLFTAGLVHHSMLTPLDEMIPLVPVFALPYVISFAQWGLSWLMISRESKEHCWRMAVGDMIAKVICLACFIGYPTIMERPVVEVDGFLTWLVNLIYSSDDPVNLFPSIHCLASFYCFAGCVRMKSVPKWYKWGMGIMSAIVCASTVFVKQHVVWDIAGGIGAAAFGLAVSSLIFFLAKRNRNEK